MGNLAFEQGTYMGRITKWGLSPSKTKGTPQFFVSFVPLGRIDPATPEDTENLIACPEWERTVYRPITEGTIDYVANDLALLGYKRDTFDQLDPAHPQAHSFADQEIRVRCKHEEYQNKLQERWDFALGAAGTPKPIEESGVKKLNAMFGKKLKEVSKAPSQAEKDKAGKAKAAAAKKEMEEVL